ncbi:MAG: hypothetical protein Q8M11_06965 [Sulfuritalea sp.]|nr:hypothetical protein [Sulfuritalea sp.]MDP1984756.1 hypothetical protein [Sulfuritalea sp.]
MRNEKRNVTDPFGTITAGLFGQWMRIQFIGLRVRDAYDAKSENFVMPFPGQDQRLQC